jgi:hypothetical protein
VAGIRLASTDAGGWTVETIDLELTGRRRGHKRISADPLGDGPQLMVCRFGRLVAFCAGLEDLPEVGVDLSRMAVVSRWLVLALHPGDGHMSNAAREDQAWSG